MRHGSCIESLGVFLPEQVLSTKDLEDKLKLSKPLRLEILTGIPM